MSSTHSEVVFFLGAGASVPAGVPDTHGIVNKFLEHVRQWPDRHRTVLKIIEILQKKYQELGFADKRVDVELLLETLERLGKREQELVLWFYEPGKYLLEGTSRKVPLEDELKDYIKQKAIVEAKKITYLEPLLAFIEEDRAAEVFSVNYDTCIEQFCNSYRKDLQDGFDIYWNPETLKKDTDVRLYKLHGSVTWYRSDRGNYLKIPVIGKGPSLKLVTGEKAESLILYPMRKWEYAEPMLELLGELKQKLETARYVFVIGYSFRDDHIRRIFWDVARKNKSLVVFLVGPHAPEVFNEKLRYYEEATASEGRIPSSVDNRVISLPYKFEDVFPLLRNHYLGNLRSGQNEERAQGEAEIGGRPSNWSLALKHFVECEYLSKIPQLLEKVDFNTFDWSLRVEISFKMLVNAIAAGYNNTAREWVPKLTDAAPWVSTDKLKTEVMISPPRINIAFTLSETSYLRASHIVSTIGPLARFAQRKSRLIVEKNRREVIEKVAGSFSALESYLSDWSEDGMEYSKYLESRRQRQPEQMATLEESYGKLISLGTRQYEEKLHHHCMALAKEIEQKELSKVLSQFEECLRAI